MAARLALVVVAVALLAGGVTAQSPPPSSSGCTQTLLSMSPCLNYLTGNETAPSASCCSKLGDVVKSQPECLCVALNADPASLGLSIDRARALGLPDACKVKTPSASNCKSGAGAPTTTPSPAGTGSKATPTTPVGAGVRVSPVGVIAGIVVAAVYAVSAV
uniref:Bifunctional inhibitor/plant lipid transfer protein/seed storage helical domain-containing protein n=1 Tax=Leersia perrieri TaxID=77586 RepID=A0A0D9WW34_9ORYZ